MYTGIVQGTGIVLDVRSGDGFKSLLVSNLGGLFNDAFVGASVAIDGVCLTVTSVFVNSVTFDVSDKTNLNTSMQYLSIGDEVNIERSHITGSENGGHSLYGHIEGVAEIVELKSRGETVDMILKLPPLAIKYFFSKGFIGMHGASLTVHDVDRQKNHLSVSLIPETIRLTNFRLLRKGSFVNIEVDHATRVMVDAISATLRPLH
ncbi:MULTISPECIES: riboflavin synthase subunit alpha [unclassified Pseudomonas]|uniref:riboflavin synthase subunit alpha n=1 Tax=unclassified Pseudomonas TaxID=196821 RepID=UPI001887B3F7|nr:MULTISPECIES: riboflavin synthase subunit alpha [unclassified Pseudomonas]MCK3852714.1 riboflavin synthase subunit alpha [Pseudomonas sp. W2Jun17]QOY68923.1 riboflavin synthase subunit alpha [Pseudomonas sp. OST1909]UEH06345.1 riboflavin synthase subunit alpha [Pseudomonas sp. HN8-3]